jgi:hypothetical protein
MIRKKLIVKTEKKINVQNNCKKPPKIEKRRFTIDEF